MSSNEGDGDIDRNAGMSYDQKARNIQRACDACRRKKTRCYGSKIPYTRCTNCVVYNYECTYVESAKKRSPPKSYVESLEKRVANLQQLLGKIAPEALDRLDKMSDTSTRHPDRTRPPSRMESQPVTLPFIHAITNNHPTTIPVSGVEFDSVMLGNLQDLSLGRTTRFFGKCSGVMLHQATLQLKHDYITGSSDSFIPNFPPVHPHPPDPPRDITYSFPEEDFMQSLIELYFAHQNIFLPLLHRPTFEKSVADGLHLSDDWFAEKLLLVCAIASRYSDDPRVLLDDMPAGESCGWKWFSQVQVSRISLLRVPTTDSMQFCCLISIFLQGSTVPPASWRFAGLGLRVAQDMGAHRRKAHNHAPSPEDESMKRAFWSLLLLDRMLSASLGRSCAIQDEDYDIDLPTECDDEWWDHPDPRKRFKQPANKPSVITYFICQIKLYKILAFILRTLYSVNKSKILLGFAVPEWEDSVVGELDVALNQFIDSLPNHLRWDPDRKDRIFFEQSAALHSTFHQLQMFVHRPFIPSPTRPTALHSPSLALCTGAARSCSRILGVLLRRSTLFNFPFQISAFYAGIVLLLNIWGGKRSGLTSDPHKDMEYVHKCMDVLKVREHRWHAGARLWDILHDLASVGDTPLPESVVSTNKRERDEDNPQPFPPSAPASATVFNTPSTQLGMPRNVVTPKRLSWNNSSGATGATAIIPSHSLQHPQLQHAQSLPPLERSLSQSQLLQQQPLEHTERLPTYPPYGDNPGLDRQPSYCQPASSNQQQCGPPYRADAQYWCPPVTGDTSDGMLPSMGDGNIQPPANQPTYAQTRSMPSFSMDDDVPYDATRLHHSSGSYVHSSGNDGLGYYTSTQPHDSVQQYPVMLSRYTGHSESQAQQQQNVLENDAYEMWSTAPSGLEWDGWAHYLSNISSMPDEYPGAPGPVAQ